MGVMLLRTLFLQLVLFFAAPAFCAALPLDRIELPPGFHIEVLARIPNAREMVLGDNNVLFVGSMQEGKVHALVLDKNYQAQKLYVVAAGLHLPVGVAYRDGNLYVSAVERILRFDDIEGHASRMAIHRFRPGWLALCPRGRALQYLRTRCALRHDPADETGWIAAAGFCARDTQYGRIRLGSENQRAVVHRQWSRHAGR
jgi:hypothetical protein